VSRIEHFLNDRRPYVRVFEREMGNIFIANVDVAPELGVSTINFPHAPPAFDLVYVAALLGCLLHDIRLFQKLERHSR
jgi:hypothetical protein